jgi:hypothetical protein
VNPAQQRRCILGHSQRAYECPSCGEAATGEVAPLEHWRWYRTRTSSVKVKARIDEYLSAAVAR